MTKKDLIEIVSQKAKLSKKASKSAVETFLNEIMKALSNGETVKLSGFGTFKTKMFKAKTIKAIGTKESKKIEKVERFLTLEGLYFIWKKNS